MTVNDKIKARARWYIEYEQLVTETIPALCGKIDWPSAAYFYDSGKSAQEAAQRTIDNWRAADEVA